MKELLDRIESCNYECEAGPLTGNVDWLELRELLDNMQVVRTSEYGKTYVLDPLDQPGAE